MVQDFLSPEYQQDLEVECCYRTRNSVSRLCGHSSSFRPQFSISSATGNSVAAQCIQVDCKASCIQGLNGEARGLEVLLGQAQEN